MRVRSISLLLVFVFLFSFPTSSYGGLSYDFEVSGQGGLRIESASYGSDMRILVEKNGESIVYPLKGSLEEVPLQLGEGSYAVKILKNIEGNKYQVIGSESIFSLGTPTYLESAQPVYWSASYKLKELSGDLKLGSMTDIEKIETVYQFITRSIEYDYDKINTLKNDYVPVIDDTIVSGKGICYDYSALFAALMRLNGIPAKLIKGYRSDLSAYHAWNEVIIDGKWYLIDTTYDAAYASIGIEREMFQDPDDYTKSREY